MKILFSGGGTLGPVTPLLALKEMIVEEFSGAKFLWIGTVSGIEKELIEKEGIPFQTISSGKLRRYFSFLNFFDLFRFIFGFFESLIILHKQKPDLCVSAGGFVSVPVHYAAVCLGIPTWIHQQDIRVGLANRLMSFVAEIITVVNKEQQKNFSVHKTMILGNPIRKELFFGDKNRAKKIFNISSNLPVVFAVGGGTGSVALNNLVVQAVPELEGVCEIIHVTGKDRPQEVAQKTAMHYAHYHPFSFFKSEMKDAYALADIVISRGGFGSLTELAALHKTAILIPKPGHQEENVNYVKNAGAVVALNEGDDNGFTLARVIKELLNDKIQSNTFADNLSILLPPASKQKVSEIIKKVV